MDSREISEQAANVSSYLESKGWVRDGERRGATTWHLGDDAWVLVPDVRQYDDASLLLHEAVAGIAKCEARPEGDVWRDIEEPMVDAQFFRLHPDAPSGSIPLWEGLRAAQGVFDIMKAAAAVTEQGPLLIEGTQTPRVRSFVRRVLLGSAAPGSYILTARVPATEIGAQELDTANGNREFTGRAIAARLRTAVNAAQAAAQRVLQDPNEMDAFYSATESGVSANLCKALSDLGGESRDKPFEMGFSWARGKPGQQPTEVKFTSSMSSVLFRASNELTSLARSGTATITGRVTDLHAEDYLPSRIKIWGDLQAPESASLLPQRSIWVVLTDSDYRRAIEAHRDVLTVEATGQLTTSNRRLELRARTFEVFRS
jgi:hypothetical protein